MITRSVLLIALSFPMIAAAETAETNALAARTTDYARCLDVTLGHFDSDIRAQEAMKVFYAAMIANIRKSLASELEARSDTVKIMDDMMGREIMIGYFLKSFSEVDQAYRSEKQKLSEDSNWDWKRVNAQLWARHGCNTIYEGLVR